MWWESQDLPWVHRRRRTARWVRANSACRSLERSANRYGLHDTAGLRSDTYHPYARYLRAGKPLCPPPSMCARSEPRATPPSGEPPPTSQTADGWVGEGFGSVLVSIGVRDPSTWSTRPSIGSGRQPSGRKAAWFSKRILSDAVLPRNGGRSGGAGRAIHRPGTHHGSCSSAFPGQALGSLFANQVGVRLLPSRANLRAWCAGLTPQTESWRVYGYPIWLPVRQQTGLFCRELRSGVSRQTRPATDRRGRPVILA